jgi:hypothetical protein
MSKRHKNRAKPEDTVIIGSRNPGAEAEAPGKEAQKSAGTSIQEGQRLSNITPIRSASIPEHAEQIIRCRAYELYERRGREEGHAEEDWLRAEAEVLGTVFRRARAG